jgi:hypothetical protein
MGGRLDMSFGRSFWLNLLILFLFGRISYAQETIEIKNASSEYDLKVQVKACGGEEQDNQPDKCGGPGRVSIYRKGAKTPFQVLSLSAIEIDKGQLAYDPELARESRKIYDDEYSFIFGDFNFDGMKDLAVCNGRNGGYGAPSYNVYLFNSGTNRFIENRRLSELTEGVYLGLFFVDAKKRLLVAFSKSGCCYHETEKYHVVANRPVLVEKITEEVNDDGDFMVITTRRLVNGRWVKRVRKEKIVEDKPKK